MKKTSYEKRIVGFLDILGWRALVSESMSNPNNVHLMAATLRIISDRYEVLTQPVDIPNDLKRSIKLHPRREQDGWPRDFQFAQFSDSIILSAKATRLTPAVFLDDVMRFTSQLF